MSDIISSMASEAHRKFSDKLEKLTKEQFFDCFHQAIASGDFERSCTPVESNYNNGDIYNTLDGTATLTMSQYSGMTYEPYRKASKLEFELKQKDELLKSCVEEMKIVICGGDFDATPMANLILMIKENVGEE